MIVGASSPIGFFDSGIGGLSVLREVRCLLPAESCVYIADNANCPYGNRRKEGIIALARRHTESLLASGAKMVVVACNTATAAAIDVLRREYTKVPFVGMEPAVKPAAIASKSGVVAVLATRGTFSGRLYNSTCEKYASGVKVIAQVADEFVQLVERGEFEGEEAESIVRKYVEPLVCAGADHIVLGCTHFPFLKPLMERVAAGKAKIVDPSIAVALRVRSLLEEKKLFAASDAVAHLKFISTGNDYTDIDRFLM